MPSSCRFRQQREDASGGLIFRLKPEATSLDSRTLIPSRRVNRVAVIAAVTGLAALALGIRLVRNDRLTTRDFALGASPLNARPTPQAPPHFPRQHQRQLATARPPAKRAPTSKRAEATPAPAAAPSETGSLHIVSDVPGAQVFLDRQFIGAAPVTANDLKPGTYQLNVSAQGFESHAETVEVAAGSREISVNFRTVRLDTSLDVIHKHRMGSCRGKLVATPAGLRYDTSDKDDVFLAALPDLETFQVDYLNKNLRIQPRRGKRYDFTDPDGNADRLFVFHRDVERARARSEGRHAIAAVTFTTGCCDNP